MLLVRVSSAENITRTEEQSRYSELIPNKKYANIFLPFLRAKSTQVEDVRLRKIEGTEEKSESVSEKLANKEVQERSDTNKPWYTKSN